MGKGACRDGEGIQGMLQKGGLACDLTLLSQPYHADSCRKNKLSFQLSKDVCSVSFLREPTCLVPEATRGEGRNPYYPRAIVQEQNPVRFCSKNWQEPPAKGQGTGTMCGMYLRRTSSESLMLGRALIFTPRTLRLFLKPTCCLRFREVQN